MEDEPASPSDCPRSKWILEKLPQELRDMVISSLPPASRACLALSCKRMKEIVAPKFYVSVGPYGDQADRHDFLELLERDYPWSLHCHECNALHTMPENKGPKNIDYEDDIESIMSLQCRAYGQCVRLCPSYQLHFQQYYLLMKQIRKGWGWMNRYLLDAFTLKEDLPGYRLPGIRHSVTPRIIQGELILLVEYSLQKRPTSIFYDNLQRIRICPHLNGTRVDAATFKPYRYRYHDQLSKYLTLGASLYSSAYPYEDLHRCQHCYTEYVIISSNKELLLKVWLDLGSGKRRDLKWEYYADPDDNPVPVRPIQGICERWTIEDSRGQSLPQSVERTSEGAMLFLKRDWWRRVF